MSKRIATFMFYLSDVRLGGATIFPKLGLGVHPEKGSAILWFNLAEDGTCNPMYDHASCPVLLGDKWVGNKWIHYHGQTWTKEDAEKFMQSLTNS